VYAVFQPEDTAIESLKNEIVELKAEIERLKSRQSDAVRSRATAMAITGTLAVGRSTGSLTVMGLEEMILQVSLDDKVGYVNTPMAKLLGMPDRKKALGTALADWDRNPSGEGVLQALVDVARSCEEAHVLERICPDMDPDMLPDGDALRPAGPTILRFTATGMKGRVNIVVQDVTRMRWLESTFSRYVSPAIIEQMRSMTATDFLSTERRELTLLFSDLRGFTAMSQRLSPEQVHEMVNSFLSNMVDCVARLDGTVDKFVGDEIMVIFGAPVPMADHALRALLCGVEMQRVHAEWSATREAADLPVLPMGVGLATGLVVVGNVGTPTRMDYTALGHAVNLAARLCSAAEPGEVLTVPASHAAAMKSLSTYQGSVKVPRLSFQPKGKLNFKNVSDPVDVVSVKVKALS